MPRKAHNTQEHNLAVLDPRTLEQIRIFSGVPDDPTQASAAATAVFPELPHQALIRTQTQYTTAIAVQKARSIARMLSKVLEEARLAGESFYYYWEVEDRQKGRKVPVEGPSIDLAMSLARNYENCAVDVDVTETLTHYLFKGVFIDLETGFTYTRLFRQRKGQRISARMCGERQEDIVFQIGQSKTQRNAITRAIPGWLVDKAIETAKQAVLSGINPETLHPARMKVLDFFGKYGVGQAQIEHERGRPIDQRTPRDIVDLRGMATTPAEGPPQEPTKPCPDRDGKPQPVSFCNDLCLPGRAARSGTE
jgi:hypothetical protein